ncbi:MAG: peptide chain release factor N(5)-glutamine methyltransferase [Desulfobacteraceae bacterium]|nr:peptide chain release factor N(5)-glutamine methyltransferase [Desulfobacteraceae bacterium]
MPNHKSQKPQTWTVLDALQWTAGYFDTHHIDSPRLTAEILLAAVLGLQRIDLYIRHDQPLSGPELAGYREMIRRRVRREPVAYILREKEFWGREFLVTPDVLIPRPETEHLVEAALARLPDETDPARRVIDLGTGSGAVAVSLAADRPGHIYFAVDRSHAALRVARKNAWQNGVSGRIHFFAGSWMEAIRQDGPGFDLIVSNPPYVPSGQIGELQPEIHDHEPRMALDGQGRGMAAIETIIRGAPQHLAPGGVLLLEIGYDQKAAILEFSDQVGVYGDPGFIRDYAGHDRVAILQKM